MTQTAKFVRAVPLSKVSSAGCTAVQLLVAAAQ